MLRFSGDVQKIQFKYDKVKGYHVHCVDFEDMEETKALARLEKAKKICNSVFGGQQSHSFGSAIDAIMKATKKAETTAKSIFKDMKAHEMIFQGIDKNWRIKA